MQIIGPKLFYKHLDAFRSEASADFFFVAKSFVVSCINCEKSTFGDLSRGTPAQGNGRPRSCFRSALGKEDLPSLVLHRMLRGVPQNPTTNLVVHRWRLLLATCSLPVLIFGPLQGCTQNVDYPGWIRCLRRRPIVNLAVLPVNRTVVIAEMSSVAEQTSQHLHSHSKLVESLALLKKSLHGLNTVKFDSKRVDGLQALFTSIASVDRPSLRPSRVAKEGIKSANDSNLFPKRSLLRIHVDLPRWVLIVEGLTDCSRLGANAPPWTVQTIFVCPV